KGRLAFYASRSGSCPARQPAGPASPTPPARRKDSAVPSHQSPVAGSDPTIWDEQTDIVVLGTGAAGLTAALTAAVEGAAVALFEKAPTVGGTSAVSGGLAWIPAHSRAERELTVADALAYLGAQSLDSMDDELVEVFVRTGARMLDYVELHSGVKFEVAD